MKKIKELKGIIPAMVTPFDQNEKLDIPATRNLVNHLIKQGVHGLFIAGTNGEAHLMSHDEVVELTNVVSKEVAGRIPVISGAGRCSTLETIMLANRIKEAGADYISLVTPSYLVPNQEDLYHHYKLIAEHVDAPLILYNIPSQTGMKIDPSTAERLASINNICGIKDSGGQMDIQKEYIEISKTTDFVVLNGSDSLILDAFKAGAVASVAATANVLPKIEVELYHSFLQGNLKTAQELRNRMDPLRMNLKKGVAPSIMKATMNLMGLDVGMPRRPISYPSENLITDLDLMNKEYGFE